MIKYIFIIVFSVVCKFMIAQLHMNNITPSPCYAHGSAHQCMPPFSNIVENMLPKIETFCKRKEICHPKSVNRHFITDHHLNNNQSCWSSGPLQANHVNITFSFGKRFEIYYISLIPCDFGLPNGIAFYKSNDFGKSWIPWHYIANNCRSMFNIDETVQPSIQFNEFGTKVKQQKPRCFQLSLSKSESEPVIAFNTVLEGTYDNVGDMKLIDWMSASDIRISLFKSENFRQNKSKLFRIVRNSSKRILSLADISIGGRCKCNGHANVCSKNILTGQLECQCQHNTEGQDCERCKPNYLDLPWARATVNNPALCKKCECNLHASSCSFNREVYIIRKQLTGGVCTNCQHNTAGTRCHYCADGYYRDWTKPLDHKFVCKKCSCHAIGAKFPHKCDKRTSQCVCKKGVTGEVCNRCLPGYRQTNSTDAPCIRNIQMEPAENKCKVCNSRRSRIRFKKFCRKDAVFAATLQSHEIIGDFIRFDVTIDNIWHSKVLMRKLYPNMFDQPIFRGSGKLKHSPIHRPTNPIWLKSKDLKCNCVPLHLGQTYLFTVKSLTYQYQNRAELLIKSHRSVILIWNSSWKRRLNRFKQKKEKGECSKFQNRSQFRKPVQWYRTQQFIG